MDKFKKAQKHAERHILNAIDGDGFDGDGFDGAKPETEKEKADFSYQRFVSEYYWNVEQVGEFKAVTNWLQGLALNIAFYNHDIIRLAKEWGSLPYTSSEAQEDRILESYWRYMAMRLIDIWSRNNVKGNV